MRAENQRTPEEILTDKVLLLSLFSSVSKKHKIGDMLKAQKLAFLAAVPLFWQSKKAFSLEFYRYRQGPMSNAVYGAIDDFDKLQLMLRSEYLVSDPKDRANEFATDFVNEVLQGIKSNHFCARQIDDVANTYGQYSGDQLRDFIYQLSFKTIESDQEQLVKDVPKLQHFSYAIEDDEAKERLEIPKAWLDTMAIVLNPFNYNSLLRAELSDNVDN